MAREKKQRISIASAPELQTNPFAALEIQGRESPLGDMSAPPRPTPPSKERLLLRRETAHRGGKTVLVLEGFSPAWHTAKLEGLLRELKSALGCGGKINGRHIELQGELADRLIPLLNTRDFTIKRGW